MASQISQLSSSSYFDRYPGYYRGHSMNPSDRTQANTQHKRSDTMTNYNNHFSGSQTNDFRKTVNFHDPQPRLMGNQVLSQSLDKTYASSYFHNSDIVQSVQPGAIQLSNYNTKYSPTNRGT